MKNLGKIILALLILALIVFLVIRFINTRNGAEPNDDAQEIGDGSVSVVSDQSSDQLGLIVDRVAMPEDGFVVVKGVVNGQAGLVVGNSLLLEAGVHEDVQILMELVQGQEYEVVLYRDNGNGIFDDADQPFTLSGGAQISTRFTVLDDESSETKG